LEYEIESVCSILGLNCHLKKKKNPKLSTSIQLMPNQRCEVSDKMGVKCNIIPKNLLLQQSLFTQAIVMCQNITIGVLESRL
jgi:hypothetical protein